MTVVEPVVPDDVGPQRLSVSQAGTWETCPAQWAHKYLGDIEDEPGPDARRGTLVHAALEHLGLLPPDQRTVGAAYDIARRVWPEVDPDPVLQRLAWRNVTRSLRLPQVVADEIIETELDFTGDRAVVLDGVPFTGKIDVVARMPNGRIKIADYKDGKRPVYVSHRTGQLCVSKTGMEEKRRQVVLYAAAYPLTGPDREPPATAEVVYTAAVHVDRFRVSPRDIARDVEWLKGVWVDIRTARATGQFATKPGALCSWCPAVGVCPDGQEAVRERAENPEKSIGEHGAAVLAAETRDAA